MTAFLSLYLTIGNQLSSFPILNIVSKTEHIRVFLFSQLALGLISVISSMPVITKGLKKLITLRADSDSMTAVTALSCIISMLPAFYQTDMAKDSSIHIYMAVGILALLINSLGKLLIIRRAARNFRFVSKNFDRHGVTYVTDEERAEPGAPTSSRISCATPTHQI